MQAQLTFSVREPVQPRRSSALALRAKATIYVANAQQKKLFFFYFLQRQQQTRIGLKSQREFAIEVEYIIVLLVDKESQCRSIVLVYVRYIIYLIIQQLLSYILEDVQVTTSNLQSLSCRLQLKLTYIYLTYLYINSNFRDYSSISQLVVTYAAALGRVYLTSTRATAQLLYNKIPIILLQ